MKQLKFTSNTTGEKTGIAVSRTNKKLFECSLKFLFINQTEYKLFFFKHLTQDKLTLLWRRESKSLKTLVKVQESSFCPKNNFARIISSSHLYPPSLAPAEIKCPSQWIQSTMNLRPFFFPYPKIKLMRLRRGKGHVHSPFKFSVVSDLSRTEST